MSLTELFHPTVILPWLLGMVFGIFVGATPGLTATMAVALIVPISFQLPANAGLALIIGVSFTAIFAGDIPATYLRIPGTPASAAATLDGHQLARRGEGSLALKLDLFCSAIGGLIGVGLLILVSPQLAQFALQFSHYEYFWLGVLGLSMSALVSAGSTMRGLMTASLGALVSTVGMDGESGTPRFSYGNVDLQGGLDFIPVMIGLFGLSEVLRSIQRPASLRQETITAGAPAPIGKVLLTIWRHKWNVLRSSISGTVIGALPGAGADIAAWGAYGIEQRISRRRQEFGTGIVDGVVAPTSANNAAVAGAWIPALVFGVPGDAVTAIVLGALMVHDITPGPRIFQDQSAQVAAIFAIALITQFLLLPAGLIGIRGFGLILRLPRNMLLAGVVVFSVVGAFALHHSLFDVWVMLAFGLVGYFLEAQRAPIAPLILGLILGPMVEKSLRRGLISSSGDLWPFFDRPICMTLVTVLVLAIIVAPVVRWLRRAASRVR